MYTDDPKTIVTTERERERLCFFRGKTELSSTAREREMEKKVKASRFQGKVSIVTASTQGIGFSIAERLGLEGSSVVISSRKQVSS